MTPTYLRVYALMKDGKPRACADIARELDCHHTGVSVTLKQLRREGEAHIARWMQKATGAPCAEWVLGSGDDAPRPAVMTKTDRRKTARKRKLAKAAKVARDEWKRRVSEIKPFRDPFVVALFGEYTP